DLVGQIVGVEGRFLGERLARAQKEVLLRFLEDLPEALQVLLVQGAAPAQRCCPTGCHRFVAPPKGPVKKRRDTRDRVGSASRRTFMADSKLDREFLRSILTLAAKP